MADDLDALIASTPAAKAEHELDALIDSTPSAPEGPGMAESFLRGGGQGVTLGYGDELAAGAGAAGGQHDHPMSLAEQVARYRTERDANRRDNSSAQQAHPTAYMLGNILGGGLASAVIPGGKAAKGAGLVRRGAVNALNGGITGSIAGLGASDANLGKGDWAQALADTAMGGGVGGLLGLAVPAAIGGVKGLAKTLLRGAVKPSEAGAALRAMGAKDLTLGQLAPEGLLNHIEQGSEKSLFGHAIKSQRDAGVQSWQKVVLPGEAADPAERLAAEYAKLGHAYDAIGETPIVPGVKSEDGALQHLGGAFSRGAEDPSAVATDADIGSAKRFLSNEASALTRQQQMASANMPGPITLRQLEETPVPASMVTKARSNIRGAIRDAKSGATPDFTLAKLLGNAEQSTTQSLEEQLPADQLAKLRTTDAAYREHMTVGDAIRRSGDRSEGFTPSQLSAAVKSATPNGAYARGAGGRLRELAQLGKETLDAKYPANGSMLMMKIPGVHHVIDGVSAVANLPGPKAFILGETAKQKALQSLVDNGPSQELIANILRALPSTRAASAGLTEAMETP